MAKNNPLIIARWITGLYTNRNPLNPPIATSGLNSVSRFDALIDGQNIELTPQLTLARRPGFPAVAGGTVPGTETVNGYYSAHLIGNEYVMFDTEVNVYAFWNGVVAPVFGKSLGAKQTSFQRVGSVLYYSDGVSSRQWNGSTDSRNGIDTPVTAPALTFTVPTKTSGWLPNTNPTGPDVTYGVFILDNNGNIQLSGLTGPTGSTLPIWNNTFGGFTPDGSNGSWRNMGTATGWAAGALIQPQTVIIDSNGNFQYSITGGISGAAAPGWSAVIDAPTVDNTVTWYMVGFATPVISYNDWSWCYSYHSNTGHVSTASPSSTSGVLFGDLGVTLTGNGSAEPECDLIYIYRTEDGGNTYFLVEVIANPGATTWTYNDIKRDNQLLQSLVAPTAHINDPPPAGLNLLTFHQGRMFGAVGNYVYFAAGPETLSGIPEQAWPPANVLPVDSTITAMASTSYGLLVFTAQDLYVVLGGPQVTTYYINKAIPNFGIANRNCLAQDGDQLFFYSSSRQLFSFSPDEKTEIGFNVADLLASVFDPATTYVVLHRSGEDIGVFLSDGSTNLLRYDINHGAWGSLSNPVGGVGAIGSVVFAPGNQQLFATLGQTIAARSLTTFADLGSAYPAFFTVGSLQVANGGILPTDLGAFYIQRMAAGTDLSISVLQNEISGIFVDVPLTANYPFNLEPSASVPSKRYDWKGIQQPMAQFTSHIQVKITFSTEAAKNELLNLSIVDAPNIT